MSKTLWTIGVYRHEPETRWFQRYILRRRSRARLIQSIVPKSVKIVRQLNGPDRVEWHL